MDRRLIPWIPSVKAWVLPCLGLLLVFGCGDIEEQAGSLFYVNSISGSYQEGTLTNQVDVIFISDCDGDPETSDPEFYSDHFTEAVLINRPLPNAEEQTASTVYISSYIIYYTPLDTVTVDYPLPSPVVIDVIDTQGIPPCNPGDECTGTIMDQLYFVPIETKATLRGFWQDAVLDGHEQLAYNCRYRFTGENDFGEPIAAEAQYNFLVSSYDYCD